MDISIRIKLFSTMILFVVLVFIFFQFVKIVKNVITFIKYCKFISQFKIIINSDDFVMTDRVKRYNVRIKVLKTNNEYNLGVYNRYFNFANDKTGFVSSLYDNELSYFALYFEYAIKKLEKEKEKNENLEKKTDSLTIRKNIGIRN